jgi:hypothetical protein
MEPKMSENFGTYSGEIVVTVIVITEFDCILDKNHTPPEIDIK